MTGDVYRKEFDDLLRFDLFPQEILLARKGKCNEEAISTPVYEVNKKKSFINGVSYYHIKS